MSQVNYYCGAIILLLTAGTIRAGTPSVMLVQANDILCPGATFICTTSCASGLTWTFQNLPQDQATVTFTVANGPSDPTILSGIFSIRLHNVTDLGSFLGDFTSTLTFGVENIQTSVSISCSDQINTEETGILDAEAVCPGGIQNGGGGDQNGGGGDQNGGGGDQNGDGENSGIQIAGSIGYLFVTIVITLYHTM